mgnify:CR=1 FL=1
MAVTSLSSSASSSPSPASSRLALSLWVSTSGASILSRDCIVFLVIALSLRRVQSLWLRCHCIIASFFHCVITMSLYHCVVIASLHFRCVIFAIALSLRHCVILSLRHCVVVGSLRRHCVIAFSLRHFCPCVVTKLMQKVAKRPPISAERSKTTPN